MAELFANVGRKSGKLLFTANRICELINNHQTVAVCDVDGIREVAPIVRCKDCKWKKWADVDDEIVFCKLHGTGHNLDWFCADGEPREGDKG